VLVCQQTKDGMYDSTPYRAACTDDFNYWNSEGHGELARNTEALQLCIASGGNPQVFMEDA